MAGKSYSSPSLDVYKRQLHEPHIKLLIVGSPFFARTQQSTFQRKLEQQAKSLGNRVQFTGYIPCLLYTSRCV